MSHRGYLITKEGPVWKAWPCVRSQIKHLPLERDAELFWFRDASSGQVSMSVAQRIREQLAVTASSFHAEGRKVHLRWHAQGQQWLPDGEFATVRPPRNVHNYSCHLAGHLNFLNGKGPFHDA